MTDKLSTFLRRAIESSRRNPQVLARTSYKVADAMIG